MKKFAFKFAASLPLAFLLTVSTVSQVPESPETVAKSYFTAMQAGNWDKCAGLLHPEALSSMKRLFATILKADESGGAAKTIFGLKSNAEFDELTGAAIFERLMNFISGAVPDMKTALASSTTTILGKVSEGTDLVHIVYRSQIKMSGAEASEVEIISFKKSGSTWRALLTADMEELVNKFAEGLSGKR
ncbi:MAG: hypothetical protein JST85_14635 [Acidobacteria bacterium]|nr:hypothetical protein [Acidobacteriota bacterium]